MNKKVLLAAVSSFLLLSACAKTQAPEAKLTPSRVADAGCEWEVSKESEQIGLKMFVEKCPNNPVTFSVKNNTLFQQYSQSTDKIKLVEVFNKSSSQSPEQALKSQIIDKLELEAERENCIVAPYPMEQAGKTLLSIRPNEQYLEKLSAENDGPFSACGEYGYTNGIQYFVFDNTNQEKFYFLSIGQDFPIFDTDTIQIIRD